MVEFTSGAIWSWAFFCVGRFLITDQFPYYWFVQVFYSRLCPGRLYRRRQWHPTPVLLPGKSPGRRSLVGYSPWGHKESDTTERLHHTSLLLCRSFLVWCSWLMYFLFYWFAFGVRPKKILPRPMSRRSQPRSLVSGLILKCLIHFELVSV